MAFIRVFPTQDTSVANTDYPSVGLKDISDSNVGASEILNMYRESQAAGTASVLVGFGAVPSGYTQAVLKLFDAQHSETLPYGYKAIIRPIEQPWSEGMGLDMDYYTDIGTANFFSASDGVPWAAATGTATASFFFNTGHEDLEVDVTSMTGAMTNGVAVVVDPSLPPGDYYVKKFHSRQTHFPTKRPFLELRWDDSTGAYSSYTTYTISSGVYSGSVLDPNTLTATVLADLSSSGVIVLGQSPVPVVDPTGVLVSSVYDLKPVYNQDEIVTLHLHLQERDWNPATVATSSLQSSRVVLTDAYYGITDVVTGEVVVPLGTGTVPYTKLSYNDNGNFFSFRMANLPEDRLYQIHFLYQAPSGTWTYIPGNNNRFRVTANG